MNKESLKFLKRSEVAELLRLDLRTVDNMVAANQIPFVRIGKKTIRFDRERLNQWLREREGVPFNN